MRTQIALQDEWWVSVSEKDARLAAGQARWKAADLELAADAENHPQKIALPGGWHIGKRPLEAVIAAVEDKAKADPNFVGGGGSVAPATKRLPSHFLTYARRIKIPKNWAGQTVFLHLDYARYHVTVQVNGQKVGHYVGGMEPHRFDITAVARPGEANELVITVGDVGVSGHRQFDPHNFTGTRLPTCKELANNLVHPVQYGGFDGRGVGQVSLEAVPKVRVEYVFANPKVAAGVLRYTVALANDTDTPVTAHVQSQAKPSPLNLTDLIKPGKVASKRLVDQEVTIPARSVKNLQLDIPWTDARLWDTDDPFLYELRTTVTGKGAGFGVQGSGRPDQVLRRTETFVASFVGNFVDKARDKAYDKDPVPQDTQREGEEQPSTLNQDSEPRTLNPETRRPLADVHTDTFGFREFVVNGHDFVLNGRKIHLYGQSGHVGGAQHAMSLEQKIEFLRIAKQEGNLNHVRLHAKPQDRRWVEAADRVGMLITTETALWTTGFHSFDWAGSEEACYENVRHHYLSSMVRRDRNSPSVVIWSLSNEMSPITPWDLTYPGHGAKMSAMTRVFKRILAEVAAEDDSRVTQMSSAMDFIGNLPMYNLHYPKNWQAYPDYPHTAYWLDGAFKFRWYAAGYAHMPAWSWRKDKPLYFGEYTCVHGATPDNQASIVGDVAFEERDFGTMKVQEKLWWMEAQAYRRQDVSGFCAWAFLLGEETDCRKLLARPDAAAYVRAIRPVAVLDHNYRTDYLAGDEVAFPLSVHNDTRHDLELALVCEALHNGAVIHTETMPARVMNPGGSVVFTNRFLAPAVENRAGIEYRATLTSGGKVVDQWSRKVTVWPRQVNLELPADFGIFDPDDQLMPRLAGRGIRGGRVVRELNAAALKDLRGLWLGFKTANANTGDWRRVREALHAFVKAGGSVLLDQAPATVLNDLPVPIQNGKGYASPGDRLEITYAYPRAPFHPVLKDFNEADFALWGADYYVARSCVEIPQEGNAVPLLVAGTDRVGLSSAPLLELRYGQGSYLVSTLEILAKLEEAPAAARLFGSLAAYRPAWGTRSAAVCLDQPGWQRLSEIGFIGQNSGLSDALAADIAFIEGSRIESSDFGLVRDALGMGRTVCVHELDEVRTAALLKALALPGEVLPGKAASGEWDVFRHTHALANGMTHNYLYWIVDKSKVAPWTLAPTHPQPASALIRLPEGAAGAVSLTRRGAVTVFNVGKGMLVIDNLRWQLGDFDEPERPRRYIRCLLTNLGVPLLKGVEKRMGEEFETEAERRERGHF